MSEQEYKIDGRVVSNGESMMGIYSTVAYLNKKLREIKKLQAQLKEAEFVIRSLYNVDAMQIDRDEYDYKLESQEVVRLTGKYLAKYKGKK